MAAILFVDDESAIRDMLRMVLKLSGHVPMEAADAEHARKIVQEQKPDLALVDIMMPGEDGFSLAKDLISVSIPVLFLTARTAVADRVRGLRMGAEDYILKPFDRKSFWLGLTLSCGEQSLISTRKKESESIISLVLLQ